ncbi:MAG: alkaline phosphatase PhoX, partial [Halobacteriota archaeon]
MVDRSKRNLMKASIATLVGAGVAGVASGAEDSYRGYSPTDSTDDDDTLTEGAPSVIGDLKRFSTTAFGAEMTGPFVFEDGTLLHSIQHPSRDNPTPYDRAG